jgi:transposase
VSSQADFGRLGLIRDPQQGRRRVVGALVLVAVYSRHMFVWPAYHTTIDELIAGFERAWAFLGGVFAVVIPDNTSVIAAEADPVNPRFCEAFMDYAHARGFLVDPARVGKPKDKPRVERAMPYVRDNFFAGEDFAGLADIRPRAEHWAGHVAGRRVHGTTRRRPAEAFAAEEAPALAPPPARRLRGGNLSAR